MSKISLNYDDCKSVISSINNAVSKARDDKSSLNSALSLASGCYGGSASDIQTAITAIDDAIDSLNTFKTSFKNLVDDVKEFDGNFKSSYETVLNLVNSTVSQTLNVLTSGTNGGYGAYKTTVAGLTSNCYIELTPTGRYRVVGTSLDRASAGVKGNGATYKFGSESFYAAGLNKYVPKGASFSEFAGKYFENIQAKGTAVLSDLSNPAQAAKGFAKNTFLFEKGQTIGNVAKGLSYAAIVIDAGGHVVRNVENGVSGTKIAADLTTDVVKDLGGMAVATGCAEVGAAIGTAIPVPVVGTVAGAVLGFAAGYVGASVYNYFVGTKKYGGKTAAEWVSSSIESGLDMAGDALSSAKDAVGDFFGGVGKFVFG